MVDRSKVEKIIGDIEDLQNSNRLTQEEKDALRKAKSALMYIV